MPAARESDDPGSDGDFAVTRVFNAPRDLLFEVWTVPEHFVRWFGPRAADMPFCEIDARPGGVIHFCHRFEDGAKLWAKGVFLDVVPPERLVFTGGFVDAEGRPGRPPFAADWPLDTLIETTVLLRETDRGTSVTVRQRVLPQEAAVTAAVAQERRLARQGWTEVFDRLAEHVNATVAGKGANPNGGSPWQS